MRFQLHQFMEEQTKVATLHPIEQINQSMDETGNPYSEDIKTEVLLQEENKMEILVDRNDEEQFSSFYSLCEEVRTYFDEEFQKDTDQWLEKQKKAILGYPEEVDYYMEHIRSYLDSKKKMDIQTLPWYDSLVEGVFHENWGLAGIQKWVKNPNSSSCKVIQPRIYFMEHGEMVLQPQKLSEDRFKQLKKALLMTDTKKRENEPYQEVYMTDGTRIEIYNNTKQPTIIFRKYIVKEYDFEHIANLNTIDKASIPMLKAMVACGFNVNMVGPVRCGKTTFLTTYQSYEKEMLEGVLLETDPEIPLHNIMPVSPIIQMIADNEDLDGIVKPLMRSDGDYLIMGEARDGKALRQMVLITKKGTRRVKGTFHTGNAEDFCFDIAQEIVNSYGGSEWAYMIQAAKGFHFLFEFASSTENRSEKKLKGIHEIRLDLKTLIVSTNMICRYNKKSKDWEYNFDLSDRVVQIGEEEDEEAFAVFRETLKKLAEEKPMEQGFDPTRISPFSLLIPTGG
ncbi:hypothetical protein AWH48_16800 [Domibacillus aminovorans]|uniref:Bacterial type II secretion system protein E domain-containing protein n=1 Tax=Domibacillus aminovorans TaxID=29332 RepID=A0A177KZR9_9BACI|nr:ATPase, T2SS/T4P/T4SS family [Domibacillus aminovorans]OAH58656.1 hypothetical protein AWH48_16800 [Domibacillus aminovorans]